MARPDWRPASVAGEPAGVGPLVAERRHLVRLEQVGKSFKNGVEALESVDLEVRRGEFLSLLGPSGCGKSTILRLLAGLTQPSLGYIDWISTNHDLGFVFQEPTLMPWANVFDNVWLPLRLAGQSRASARATVEEALAKVGLAGFEQGLSARTVGRHEDARLDRPRPRDPPRPASDGRAVRRARRDHPHQAQ